MIRTRLTPFRAALVLAAGLSGAPGVAASGAEGAEDSAPPVELPITTVRDIEARGRLFDRGIPFTDEAFSPDGFHFTYLYQIPGGFLSRKTVRCAFLLDLGTGDTRPIPTPSGRAARIGGWDPTGRYVLVESHKPDLFSSLTGSWTTYHFIYDVVTSDFVQRKPFTGRRDDRRFRWKGRGSYHGAWATEGDPSTVWPLYEGELAGIHQRRERQATEENEDRRRTADLVAVRTSGQSAQTLGDFLPRLDTHWTRRGQRDPVVSELFGERPTLVARRGDDWVEVFREMEYAAVLPGDLVLLTGQGGTQAIFHRGRWEMLPLPPPPEGWAEALDGRWDRAGGFYEETDPLPRDLQYRRTFDPTQGVSYYFNRTSPDMRYLLMLYSFGSDRRVVRIVDIPETWQSPITP